MYGMLEELRKVATCCLADAGQVETEGVSQALLASYRCAWPDRQ